jgi:lipopolysaccharide biosynthesis regulator YciM
MRSGRRHLGLAIALLAAGLSPVRAAHRSDPDKLPSIKVQDLHYGDVLFHYWADEDSGLEALTRLEAYNYWQRMPHHALDAQLLAAGMYLQLGMHNQAGDRFATLLGDNIPAGVRNKAWFYLGKIWYERGYFDRSEQALNRIQGELPPQQEAERTHLLVNVLMREQRYDEAIARLQSWHGPADWMAYARFNLGVALVRAGRLAQADPILTAVGTLQTDSDELLTMRDKANLALGFAYLQADQAAQARVPLERVRLDGPYSTRALLGDGWAHAALGDYRAALLPWLELHKRNLLDAAVQESYLAVPYAYGKLGAAAQAADYYESALKSFASESDNLDAAIGRIHEGHMLDDLLGTDKDARYGWFWQLKTLPDAPQSRYLYSLLADNDFQEGLKNFRDLNFLHRDLARWDESMEAFGAMIDTREHAYAERLPRTDALLATDAPTRLRAARAAVDSRLDAIETGNDVAALGTAAEREQWARIASLEDRVAGLPRGLERDEAAAKLHLIKGVLYWRLDAAFKERSYSQQRALRELDASLEELQNRWVRVQRARATVPTNTGEFADRIAALAARIQAVRARLVDTAGKQSDYLQDVAASELGAQKDRLATYAEQARFALADIYDRAADQADGASGAGAAAPAPPDAPAPAPVPAPAGPPEPPER